MASQYTAMGWTVQGMYVFSGRLYIFVCPGDPKSVNIEYKCNICRDVFDESLVQWKEKEFIFVEYFAVFVGYSDDFSKNMKRNLTLTI